MNLAASDAFSSVNQSGYSKDTDRDGKLNMFGAVGVDRLKGGEPGYSSSSARAPRPPVGMSGSGIDMGSSLGVSFDSSSVGNAPLGVSADGNIATGGSKAVLAALRALQEKIRRLETERSVALEETTRVRQEAREREIDMQRDSEKEKLTLQKTINEARVAYESLDEQKQGLGLRFVRAEEQVNELKTEISYLHEKIGGCEERLEEEKDTVRKLETALQAKKEESTKAGAQSKEITQTIVWETKRHEEEKAELVTRARQLLAELNRTKYDLDASEKRKLELEAMTKQLMNVNAKLTEKDAHGQHHHYQHHHHSRHGAHGHGHGHTGAGSSNNSVASKSSIGGKKKRSNSTHSHAHTTKGHTTTKTVSASHAAPKKDVHTDKAHGKKDTQKDSAKAGTHRTGATTGTHKKAKKAKKKKSNKGDDDSSYISSGSYYSQISGISGHSSIMSGRSNGSRRSTSRSRGVSLTRKNLVDLESSTDEKKHLPLVKKGGSTRSRSNSAGDAQAVAVAKAAAELLGRSSTPQQQVPMPTPVAVEGDANRTNITVHLPMPRATGATGTPAAGGGGGGIAFSPVLQQQSQQPQQQQIANTTIDEEDGVRNTITAAAASGNQEMAEQSFITVEDSLAKYDDALNRTGSSLRDFTTNLDTSMSLSSALAAGPGLVPANYILPGGEAAQAQHLVGEGYGSNNNRSALISSLSLQPGTSTGGSDLDSVIKSLEDEFLMLNNHYRRLLTTVQQDDSAESKEADELVTVINKLHRKGEQLRKLRTGHVPAGALQGASLAPIGLTESHLEMDRSQVQSELMNSSTVLGGTRSVGSP